MPASSTDAPRPGEVALAFDPADRVDAGLCFVGAIRSPWTKENAPRNVREARERGGAFAIELLPDYAKALDGLAVGQAIQMLYWAQNRRRDLLTQTPRHSGGQRGTFALRSPVRPNPILLATVVITAIDGATLGIDATDAIDGTPLLDIKPWIDTVDVPPDWRP
ncbi:MAG: tRNA (N6-threonylcarbamoyladenosine(37)-N6)-methyltransferase TrmO [Pseudomonadota bacterium]